MAPFLLFYILTLVPVALGHIGFNRVIAENKRTPFSLINNGYEDLLVAIDPSVAETPTSISDIKAWLTQASEAMYTATEQRAYLKSVTILVPLGWTWNSNYHLPSTETQDMANIILTSDPVPGGAAHTVRYGGCGTPGEYLVVNDRVYKDPAWAAAQFGSNGKLFIHEWGHYRWGLYDEYPEASGHQFYYYQYQAEAARCGTPVQGKFYRDGVECGFHKFGCTFVPDDDPTQPTASLMYYQFLDQVVGFCKSSISPDVNFRHNFRAPTPHNYKCGLRSAWEIMEAHEDFSAGNNTAAGLTATQAVPQFHVVQERPVRRVLILDYSASMNGSQMDMYQAVRDLVYETLEENSYFGIVGFDTNAYTIANMTRVTGEVVRESLATSVVRPLGQATGMGRGLYQMHTLVSLGGLHTEGTECLLMTDGQENMPPFVSTIVPMITAAGISCSVVEYGPNTDDLYQLATDLQGTRYKAVRAPGDPTLMDSMRSVVDSKRRNRRTTKMLSEGGQVNQGAVVSGNFTVALCMEPGSVKFKAYYTNKVSMIEASLQSPSGVVYDKTSPGYKHNKKAQSIRIKLNETDHGVWLYSITSSDPTPVTYNALAKFANDACAISVETAIRSVRNKRSSISAYMIFAHVSKGSKPVVGAKVVAKMVSEKDSFSRDLQDKGIGADTNEGDGIYSAYVIGDHFPSTASSRYAVRILVSGADGNVFAIQTVGGIGAPSKNSTNQTAAAVGNFSFIAPSILGMAPISTNATDVHPPSPVTDLSVAPVDYFSRSFDLAWTAPGDDFYFGQAVRYDMRWSLDPFQLRDNFLTCAPVSITWLNGWALTPLPGADRENLTISMPEAKEEMTYWLALVAVDDVGLVGNVSNIISVTVGFDKPEKQDYLLLFIIVASLLALVALTILVCVIVRVCKRNNKLEALKVAEAPKEQSKYNLAMY